VTDVPESHRDLLDGEIGTFASIDAAGYPQLTDVWFLYEDGDLKLSFNTGRAKTGNLRERPRCSLLIRDPESPYRYLEIRGDARIEPDDDYAFAKRVGAKYGGADLSAHDKPGQTRIVVTLEPTRVHAVDMSG
jgi:PPOX class probable F420-dependent enzyme